MYSHILIATDGSELAGKAVAVGQCLAQSLAARATVLTVTEPATNLVPEAMVGATSENDTMPSGILLLLKHLLPRASEHRVWGYNARPCMFFISFQPRPSLRLRRHAGVTSSSWHRTPSGSGAFATGRGSSARADTRKRAGARLPLANFQDVVHSSGPERGFSDHL
jgi:hypothetical protein